MSRFTVESASALPGPGWLRAERRAAAERFASAALPTDALEEWRYSRIDALDLDRYRPAGAPGNVADPSAGPVGGLVRGIGAGIRIETRDGYLVEAHGSPAGVTVESLSGPDAADAELGGLAGEPDAFATLNRAFAPAPVRIRVAPGFVAAPILLVHRADSHGVAVFPRVLIEVEPQAEVTVVEVVAGAGDALVVPVTELDVADGARLSYLHVQLLGPEAWQIGLQASRAGRDAAVTSAAVALGASYARLRTDSILAGPGGSGRLLAAYFGAGTQMHDFRTVQDHQAPKTRSELLYKGAVANTSRSVYSGLIRVAKGAHGANAFQTNRNLVLHEGAHADSVPNLEIEDNDVRCSHASAVGPIAEDQRFYLESRGVPPQAADRLITLGFLDEILVQLPVGAAAPVLRDVLVDKLAAADALEAAHA